MSLLTTTPSAAAQPGTSRPARLDAIPRLSLARTLGLLPLMIIAPIATVFVGAATFFSLAALALFILEGASAVAALRDFRAANAAWMNLALGLLVTCLILAIATGRLLSRWTFGSPLSWRALGLSTVPWRPIVSAALLGFSLPILFGVLANSLLDGMESAPTPFDAAISPAEILIISALVVLIAPLVEELIFRGVLLPVLRHRVATWLAVLITSTLFTALHTQYFLSDTASTLFSLGSVFVLGLLAATLYLRAGSLWPSIALHASYNGMIATALILTS